MILSLIVKSKNSVKVNDSIQYQVVLKPKASENAIQLHTLQTTMQVTKIYPMILLIFIRRICFMTFFVVSGLCRRKKYRRTNGHGTVIAVLYTTTQKSFQLKLMKDSSNDFSLSSFCSSSSKSALQKSPVTYKEIMTTAKNIVHRSVLRILLSTLKNIPISG